MAVSMLVCMYEGVESGSVYNGVNDDSRGNCGI